MPALGQPGRHQLLLAEAALARAHDHAVPRARRVAHPELGEHLVREPPRGQVVARGRGLAGFPQVGGVEAARPLEQRVQALAPAPALLGTRVVRLALHPHVEALRQQLHRLLEVERLGLLDELEGVAALAAAEAVVELLLGIDGERRRPLVVERTEPGPARADPAQVGLLPDQVDHVHGVAHAVDRVLREERHQNPCGTDRFSNSRIA